MCPEPLLAACRLRAAQRSGQPRPAGSLDVAHGPCSRVFDNLYFFGQTEYAVWAITTSGSGIIVLDKMIFDYSGGR